MALINRVSRLFRADFHAVLDRMEEPEPLLRQAIRDMEDVVAGDEEAVAKRLREQEALSRRSKDVSSMLEGLDRQLDLCIESGKDDLARGLVRRKLESERLLIQIGDRTEKGAEELLRQRSRLDENRLTLTSLRQKADWFCSRPATPRSAGEFADTTWPEAGAAISEDEIEIALLQEKSRRSAS